MGEDDGSTATGNVRRHRRRRQVAVKACRPHTRIWGVETAGADSMAQARAAGQVVRLPQITSIARTLGAPEVGQLPFALAQRYLEDVVVVSDAEALDALLFLLERAKVLAEPAASCTLSAAAQMRERFLPHHHVVLILCGGNLAVDTLLQWVSHPPQA